MKITTLACCLIIAFFGSACATPYQSVGATGGFSDTQLAPDVFRVSFSGNGFTSAERAQDFALLRASELCLQHGYKHFALVSAADQSRTHLHVVPGTAYTTGSATSFGNTATYSGRTTYSGPQIYNIHKPGVGLIVRGFTEKQDGIYTFDAEFLVKTLKAKYQIE